MTTKVRTLLTVAVVGAACTMAAAAYGETTASAFADNICTGVPAREREMGLLAFRDNIVSVAPLNEFHFAGKAKYLHTEGAVIKLRATPGISVPWLERVNGCHIAMMGSGRLAGNEAAMDPFILTGILVIQARDRAWNADVGPSSLMQSMARQLAMAIVSICIPCGKNLNPIRRALATW